MLMTKLVNVLDTFTNATLTIKLFPVVGHTHLEQLPAAECYQCCIANFCHFILDEGWSDVFRGLLLS